MVEADEVAQADIQVLENLQREDLGPIEEARAFKKLLDEGKHTIEGLAKRVDKSVKYVTSSVRLLELPKSAVKAIEKGTLSPEHGHQILRAPVDKRETFTEYALAPKWGGGSNVLPTIHDLTNEIERRLQKDLSKACFPKDREFAGAMAFEFFHLCGPRCASGICRQKTTSSRKATRPRVGTTSCFWRDSRNSLKRRDGNSG